MKTEIIRKIFKISKLCCANENIIQAKKNIGSGSFVCTAIQITVKNSFKENYPLLLGIKLFASAQNLDYIITGMLLFSVFRIVFFIIVILHIFIQIILIFLKKYELFPFLSIH